MISINPWKHGLNGDATRGSSKLRNRTPAELEAKFPKLRPDNYKRASEATARYNCLAFANGDFRHLWEAGGNGGRFYWPSDIPDTLDGWTQIFTAEGYELTDNREETKQKRGLDNPEKCHAAIVSYSSALWQAIEGPKKTARANFKLHHHLAPRDSFRPNLLP